MLDALLSSSLILPPSSLPFPIAAPRPVRYPRASNRFRGGNPMPVRRYFAILAAAALSASLFAVGQPLDMYTLKELDDKVDEGIAEGIYPGGVLLAGRGNDMLPIDAVGNMRTDPDVPMRADALFDLASVSKVLGTATMTMLLIEDGKLALDTRAADIFPEYGANGKDDILIRHLLTHSSGLKPYENWKTAEEIRGDSTHDDALFRRISALEEQYPTGEAINYSCLNFLSLARINEKVAGESQDAFLRRRVWQPLGMKDTTYHPSAEQYARLAPPFRAWPDGKPRIHDPLADYYSVGDHCSGNAGLYSTAEDMGRYCRMILGGGELDGARVMKPETVALMTKVHAALPHWEGKDKAPGDEWRRGLGWHVYADMPWTHPAAPPDSVIGHTGYTGTYLWLDLNSKTWFVFLTNSVYSQDPPNTSAIRKRLAKTLLEHEYGPMPEEKKAPGGG